MSNYDPKQPNSKATAKHDQIRRAMIEKGWLIPITPEEVHLAETAGLDAAAELSDRPADPLSILDCPPREPKVSNVFPLPLQCSIVREHLTGAAREGNEIPPDTETKMKADREGAQGDGEK